MLEELDIVDESFELYDNANGRDLIIMPIMDEYPSPENQFDISFGVDGEESGGGQIDPNAILGAVGSTAEMISRLKKSGLKADLKAICGRRPILKKKRESSGWNACQQRFIDAQLGTGITTDDGRSRYQDNYPPVKTGMSTGAKVGIGLGVVALGVGIFFLIKKMN